MAIVLTAILLQNGATGIPGVSPPPPVPPQFVQETIPSTAGFFNQACFWVNATAPHGNAHDEFCFWSSPNGSVYNLRGSLYHPSGPSVLIRSGDVPFLTAAVGGNATWSSPDGSGAFEWFSPLTVVLYPYVPPCFFGHC
ncbi:MAG TPA: hypothetical protein VMG14_05645 [Thermoplasmata archaeon]|nr:hypothetical protein [Thermoplasmata archaeon]